MTQKGDTYYGRGTTDDGGRLLATLFARARFRGGRSREHSIPLGARGRNRLTQF